MNHKKKHVSQGILAVLIGFAIAAVMAWIVLVLSTKPAPHKMREGFAGRP